MGSFMKVPPVEPLLPSPFQAELAGGQAALGEEARAERPMAPARQRPRQLLSLGPCVGDEPSQCLSSAERSLTQQLLGLSGASQAWLPLLPALIEELGSNELEPRALA